MAIVIKEKDKQIVYIAIFIIILVIDFFLILGWQFRLLLRNFKMANEKRQAIVALENDTKNMDKYKQETADLDKKIKDLELMVTKEQDIQFLIEDISVLASKSNIKIMQIKPIIDEDKLNIVSSKDGKFSEVEIKISATAGFHQLGNFINNIESANKFFKLSSLEIETDNKDYLVQNIRLSLISILDLKEGNNK